MARTARQRAAQRKASLASARKRRKSAKLQTYGPRKGKRTSAQKQARLRRSVKRTQRVAAGIYVASALAPTAAGYYVHHTATADSRRKRKASSPRAAKRTMTKAQKRSSRNRVRNNKAFAKGIVVTMGPARPIRQGAIAGRKIKHK